MLHATAGPSATATLRRHALTLVRSAAPPPARAVGGLAPLRERPDGAVAVLTVTALLADLPGDATIDMGARLEDLGRDRDPTFGRPGGPSVSCSVAACRLPMGQASTLGLIADLLVSNAYVHGFPPGDGGRIAVSLIELEAIVELTIDDSGSVTSGAGPGRAAGSTLARRLVDQLGGRLETPEVIGGSRYVVTLPRHAIRRSS